jgi:hypothetical protein
MTRERNLNLPLPHSHAAYQEKWYRKQIGAMPLMSVAIPRQISKKESDGIMQV